MDTEHTVNNTPLILSSAAVILMVKDVVVTSKMQDVLRDASCCVDIQAYVQRKTGWTLLVMDWVRWEAIRSAFDTLSLSN
eukprot:3356146-Ditylum_brightwellii.AAC.1